MDWADFIGPLLRVAADTANNYIVLSLYSSLMITWGYTRVYYLSFVLLPVVIWSPLKFKEEPALAFLLVLLIIHALLNFYWFYMFLQMGIRKITTG
jgi:predicted DNA-binding helix-hairpin-helix protein